MSVKRLLLTLTAVTIAFCAKAQTIRVLPAENLYMNDGRLERGVILGERVPDALFGCNLTYWNIDSTQIWGRLFDPSTMEILPYPTVYAVHRDKDYVVDSMVDFFDKFVYFLTLAKRPQLFAIHTLGYVPLIIEYEPPTVPEITKVSRKEYEGLNSTYRQTFQLEAFDSNEYQQWVSDVLDEQERTWLEQGDLWLETGRFLPMGLPAVHVVAPIDDLRRFYLNKMKYTSPIHADFAYALSPEGYFVGQVADGNLRVVWSIARIDGYEQNDLPPIVFDLGTQLDSSSSVPFWKGGMADEFRWASGGRLYFKSGNEYYKLHVDIPIKQNCQMEDIEVSEEEFFKVMKYSVQQENMIRSNRDPDAADTALLRSWGGKNYTFDLLAEESDYVWYEPGYECIEIVLGDFCCTRLKGDTVDMQACEMALSADVPRYFAGVNMEWGAGDAEVPAYIYIYPLLPSISQNHEGERMPEHIGKPYIYQTTPAWYPIGRHYFWAADGWFYIEGVDRNNSRTVYHKLHLPREKSTAAGK